MTQTKETQRKTAVFTVRGVDTKVPLHCDGADHHPPSSAALHHIITRCHTVSTICLACHETPTAVILLCKDPQYLTQPEEANGR